MENQKGSKLYCDIVEQNGSDSSLQQCETKQKNKEQSHYTKFNVVLQKYKGNQEFI